MQTENAIEDRVRLIVNTVEKNNIQEKSKELIQILTSESTAWFLEYLINSRVKCEANYPDVFAEMLMRLSNQFSKIQDEAIPVGVTAIKTILAHLPSDSTVVIQKEHLANLGRFLGLLTLARSRILVDSDLDMRSLLREAIEFGNSALRHVIPLVTAFFKCLSISRLPPCFLYITRTFRILSWLYQREKVDQQIETMFQELNQRMTEPAEDSKIISIAKVSYIAFDGGLDVNESSLMPRQPEPPSQNEACTVTEMPLQTSSTRQPVPSESTTKWCQKEHQMSAIMLSPHFTTQSAFPLILNPMQQLTKTPLLLFRRPEQPNHQLVSSINANEIADALNMQEMLQALQSRSVEYMDPTWLEDAVIFLSNRSAKFILSSAIKEFIDEAIQEETTSTITITNEVLKDLYNRGFRNNGLEWLYRKVVELTNCHPSIYNKNYLLKYYSKLLKDHITPKLRNFGINSLITYDVITELVGNQTFEKVYSLAYSIISNEVHSIVENELLRQGPQPYLNIGGTFNPSPGPFENVQVIEPLQKMLSEQQTQTPSIPPHETNVAGMFSNGGDTAPPTNQYGNVVDMDKNFYIKMMTDSDVLRQQQITPLPPQMRYGPNMSAQSGSQELTSNRYDDPRGGSQRNAMNDVQLQNLTIYTLLLSHIDTNMVSNPSRPTFIMRKIIIKYAENVNEGTLQSFIESVTNLFMEFCANSEDDAEKEELKRYYFNALKVMCEECGDEFIQLAVCHAWFKRTKYEISSNWKAFEELLGKGLVDPNMFDQFLSENIKSSHVQFKDILVSLLDFFILPPLSTESMPDENGPTNSVTTIRRFMTLNEFDLWKSLRSLDKKLISIPINSDSIRIHAYNARIRALMDWGLFESKDVQEKFSLDNVEYQSLFKEMSKLQTKNRWSKDKMKLRYIFNCWIINDQWHPPYGMTKFMKAVFTDCEIDGKEDVMQFFRALICEIIDAFTPEEFSNPKLVKSNQNKLKNGSETFGEFLALSISAVTNFHREINELTLLCQFLGVIGRKTICLHQETKGDFNPLPIKYILMKLFEKLVSAPCDSQFTENVPVAFGYLLHLLRPSRVPVFQVAFLEILENDVFVERMLNDGIKAYHNIYAQLLVDVTKHVGILAQGLVQHNGLNNFCKSLYSLWNKLSCLYPTFVCEFAHYFSNFLTPPLFKLRNLVISTGFHQRCLSWVLTTDALNRPFGSLPNPTGFVMNSGDRLPSHLKSAVESYIYHGTPVNFLEELPHLLQGTDSITQLLQDPTKFEFESKTFLNKAVCYAAINSQNLADYGITNSLPYIPELVSDFIAYLCTVSVDGDNVNDGLMTNLQIIPIVKSLLKGMGDAGQYFIISCMVSHLRYLNKHTKFFAQCLLHIFQSESTDVNLRCDIIRCLLEYLLLKDPTSEGILMTCVEICRHFGCTIDIADQSKLPEDLIRNMKIICETFIGEMKLNYNIPPKTVHSGRPCTNNILMPAEKKIE